MGYVLNKISLRLIDDKLPPNHANELVQILNKDEELSSSLSRDNTNEMSCNDFIINTIQWAKQTGSLSYAILFCDEAIGTISLSHIDYEHGKARVGYWISSLHWRKGYTSEAFKQLLVIAKNRQINSLTAKFHKQNIASRLILKKFGARFTNSNSYCSGIIEV